MKNVLDVNVTKIDGYLDLYDLRNTTKSYILYNIPFYLLLNLFNSIESELKKLNIYNCFRKTIF